VRRFLTVLGVCGPAGGCALWLNHDLNVGSQALELSVDPGTPPRGVAQAVQEAGARVNPLLLYRLVPAVRAIAPDSRRQLRDRARQHAAQPVAQAGARRGVAAQRDAGGGAGPAQVRAALQKEELLKPDTQG
jgi:UPF0755 protein